MKHIQTAPALAEQVYQAILDEICSGRFAPGTHLVQEQLAEKLGVSRQPVQQAIALLKSDGLVEGVGKRGVHVSSLDLAAMRHHYEIRALLDGLAARRAAIRIADEPAIAEQFRKAAGSVLEAGRKAVAKGDIAAMVRHDEAFHRLVYESSGNPMLAETAEPHWRFLRRVMGDVLRKAEPPREIWHEHEAIVEAVIAGDPAAAERLMTEHATRAAQLLARSGDEGRSGHD
jgi:DNA-binding GntR family transcriptional regulator